MPTYEYACADCGEHLEVVQSFRDDALTECPACDGRLNKVFSAAGIIFKGSGWHIKDYAKSSAGGSSSSDGSAKESSSSKKPSSADSSTGKGSSSGKDSSGSGSAASSSSDTSTKSATSDSSSAA